MVVKITIYEINIEILKDLFAYKKISVLIGKINQKPFWNNRDGVDCSFIATNTEQVLKSVLIF